MLPLGSFEFRLINYLKLIIFQRSGHFLGTSRRKSEIRSNTVSGWFSQWLGDTPFWIPQNALWLRLRQRFGSVIRVITIPGRENGVKTPNPTLSGGTAGSRAIYTPLSRDWTLRTGTQNRVSPSHSENAPGTGGSEISSLLKNHSSAIRTTISVRCPNLKLAWVKLKVFQ